MKDDTTTAAPMSGEDLNALDLALKDGGVERPTRRRLLEGTAVGVVAAGALGLPAGASANGGGGSLRRIASVLATSEGFGVTFLT